MLEITIQRQGGLVEATAAYANPDGPVPRLLAGRGDSAGSALWDLLYYQGEHVGPGVRVRWADTPRRTFDPPPEEPVKPFAGEEEVAPFLDHGGPRERLRPGPVLHLSDPDFPDGRLYRHILPEGSEVPAVVVFRGRLYNRIATDTTGGANHYGFRPGEPVTVIP